MKKLFTIDDFMVSFISALGYGFGETISRLMGWPALACGVASLVVGLVLGEIINKIAFSEVVQRKPINRLITYSIVFLIFLIAHTISVVWMGVSMLNYLKDEFQFVIILPVIGFVLNLLIRKYRVYKIHKLYGDGSSGFVFDLEKEEIEEFNKQNRPISGEYDEDCAIKTRYGIYVGKKEKKGISFLGIPYAKPPVGELRWKAPERLPESEAVFEAQHFGASAIQVDQEGLILKKHRQSEDCLYLNIYVENTETHPKKPVIVLFHTGDFSYGGSADPLFGGENFGGSHPDTVFVSFNFRLGIFGFIDFSEVSGGEAYGDSLNLGLLDQVAALEWVKENIAAFGGDPGRITTIGFEAGATSICLIAASGQGKDLFQKAFLYNVNPVTVYDTREGSRTLAKNLLKETGASSMDELMRLNTESLKAAAQRLWGNMSAPTCDGEWLPVDLYQAFKDGAAAGIEFIIGNSRSEMQVYRAYIGEKNYEVLLSLAMAEIEKIMDDTMAADAKEYIRTKAASVGEVEAKTKFVEQWLIVSVYLTAVRLAEGGNKVHLLYWYEKSVIEYLGSGTIDVSSALLGNHDAAQMYGTVINKNLSETLQTLFVKFINGDALRLYPNEIKGVDAIDWESFPKALIAENGEFSCAKIKDRLTEVKSFLDVI